MKNVTHDWKEDSSLYSRRRKGVTISRNRGHAEEGAQPFIENHTPGLSWEGAGEKVPLCPRTGGMPRKGRSPFSIKITPSLQGRGRGWVIKKTLKENIR